MTTIEEMSSRERGDAARELRRIADALHSQPESDFSQPIPSTIGGFMSEDNA